MKEIPTAHFDKDHYMNPHNVPSMTLDEMKLAVCEKLGNANTDIHEEDKDCCITIAENNCLITRTINWPTEGLAVCHEAEKLLQRDIDTWTNYMHILVEMSSMIYGCSATYEQRLEALCRVWFPEKFTE